MSPARNDMRYRAANDAMEMGGLHYLKTKCCTHLEHSLEPREHGVLILRVLELEVHFAHASEHIL